MDPSDSDSRARLIEGILGPHEVGVMFAIFLFGLVTIQAFTYFREYPGDHRVVKILVSVVWTLLLVHTSISAYSIYQRTVKDYGRGNLAALDRYPEGMCGAFSLSALIGSLVQSFFAHRLRKLSGQSLTAIICWFLSAVRLGSVICISVTACQATSVRPYVEQWKWLAIFALSVSAFVDLLIAGSLAWCLWSRRGHVFAQ
ncbi:hypothetical protein DXG03_003041 [Asterophora parasitica]|uniref:Uncharacterized protein n=1 Tax=Asterophora parasitica TaxID=117018 RepID=A0A9P7G885_9AGAR|nr:hypothetical protein DXG03_003041 [Asterophora parasitica]